MQQLSWQKELTASEACRLHMGNLMPFLRLTKSGYPIDRTAWFRQGFFSNLAWAPTGDGEEETATVAFEVRIQDSSHGQRNISLSYDPSRAANHSAPTVHLIYDSFTRSKLLAKDLTGHTVRLTRDLVGAYRLDIP